jgi:hypothetical protein
LKLLLLGTLTLLGVETEFWCISFFGQRVAGTGTHANDLGLFGGWLDGEPTRSAGTLVLGGKLLYGGFPTRKVTRGSMLGEAVELGAG